MRDEPTRSPAQVESDALDRLLAHDITPAPPRRYGEGDDQFFESYGTPHGRRIVLVHGGYFRENSSRDNMRPLAVALAARYPRFEIILAEYTSKHGEPEAAMDDIRGLDHYLSSDYPAEDADGNTAGTPIWIGHSAGGTLVMLHTLSRGHDELDAIALAPIADTSRDALEGGGDHAIEKWMGGLPEDEPQLYEKLDPAAQLRAGASPGGRLTIIHGGNDKRVPPEHTAALTIEATFLLGAHHFDLIDPSSTHIAEVYAAIDAMLPS